MKKITNALLALTLVVMTVSLGACDLLKSANQNNDTDVIVLPLSRNASYGSIPTLDEVYEGADLVVVATYKEITSMFAWPVTGMPKTISAFDVHEIVKGNLEGKVVNIMYSGGKVTLEEYRNALGRVPTTWKDDWWSNPSDEEARNIYVEYVSDRSLDFENGEQRYMLFLDYVGTHDVYALGLILKVNDNGQVSYLFEDEWLTPSFYKN